MSILLTIMILMVTKVVFDIVTAYSLREYCKKIGYWTDYIYVYDRNSYIVRELPSIFYDVVMKLRILEYETWRKIGYRIAGKILK